MKKQTKKIPSEQENGRQRCVSSAGAETSKDDIVANKVLEIVICLFCMGTITWFVIGSGLWKLIMCMIQGKI